MAKYVITLRNAASNLDILYQTFSTIAGAVGDRTVGLEAMAGILARERLMSSNGRTGKQARERSIRKKSSLDSMLMQAKAYAEIFRLLGWMRSESNKKRTTYRITWLGKQVASCANYLALMEECFLGLTLPTDSVIRKCICIRKLLWCYLKQLYSSQRPLVKEDFIRLCHFCSYLQESSTPELVPPSPHALTSTQSKAALASLAKQAGVQVNTLLNSTRLPIAALKRFGWTVEQEASYILSDKGKKLVESFQAGKSINYPQATGEYKSVLKELAVVGLVHMLTRAGMQNGRDYEAHLPYDTSLDILVTEGILPDRSSQLYFSPYQTLGPDMLVTIFGPHLESETSEEFVASDPGQEIEPQAVPQSVLALRGDHTERDASGPLAEKIRATSGTLEERIVQLLAAHQAAGQDIFYQAVVEAFCILGFDCQPGRQGQNGSRYDAIINGGQISIPIEIKSPREERAISVKAVRQALENRVMLCHRMPHHSRVDVSSFIVGYEYPAKRSEVHELIEAIYETYGIRIALFSFEVLMELAIRAIAEGEYPDFEDLTRLMGVVTSELLPCE